MGLSTLIAGFWAFWGGIENFHEGWYFTSLWRNLALMVVQYLAPMLVFVAVALCRYPLAVGGRGVALRWGRAYSGVALYRAPVAWHFIVGPLLLLGLCYSLGRPRPRRWAAAVVVGLPLLTLIICMAEPVVRVAGRVGRRRPRGAPGGRQRGGFALGASMPGWPPNGVRWDEAVRRCRFLRPQMGRPWRDSPQDIWRSPTVEEAVRSQCRHGQNAGGTWDTATGRAEYRSQPDKESPLWDPHSQVIYWWTATEVNEAQAFIIVYNGSVWPRPKNAYWGYLGFRAVRTP